MFQRGKHKFEDDFNNKKNIKDSIEEFYHHVSHKMTTVYQLVTQILFGKIAQR